MHYSERQTYEELSFIGTSYTGIHVVIFAFAFNHLKCLFVLFNKHLLFTSSSVILYHMGHCMVM